MAQLMVRLRVSEGRIDQIETIVARRGDSCCWDPAQLTRLADIYDQPVPPNRRASRGQLVAIADEYFSALHAGGTADYRRPPIAAGMNRYENGQQSTNVHVGGNRITRWDAGTQLDSAMVGPLHVVDRRFPVVDIEHGTILGIVLFEHPTSGQPPGIVSEFFKISDDRIQEIRAVIVRRPSTGWN